MSSVVTLQLKQKVTKVAVIAILSAVLGIIGQAEKLGYIGVLDGALIGYAIGDAITVLQDPNISNSWQIASAQALLISVLTVVGSYIGQLVGLGIVSQSVGAMIGYAIGEVIQLVSVQTAPVTSKA